MPLTASQLRTDLTEHEGSRRTLSVTVPGPLVRAELDLALQRVAAQVKLPGFRKGKAPAAAVDRQYGAAVRRETLQRLIDEAYRTALSERSLQAVSEGEVEGVDFQPEAGLTFRISFDVPPVIELSRLGGFAVRRPAALVQSQDVEEALASLREEHAIWRPPDEEGSPRAGDLVTVRILTVSAAGGVGAGKPDDVGLPWARRLRLRASSEHRGRYQFVLGGEDAAPALGEAIGTLLPGETRDFTLAIPDESGGGSHQRRLRITLEDRQVKELPELDDDFACSLGDFEGLDALRAKIADDLREEAASRAEAVLRARLLDQVVAANPFQIPPVMVERYARSLMEDGGDAGAPEIGAERLRQAEDAVKRMMVVERIAELHGLAAAPAEIDARVAEIALRGQVTPERVRDQLVRTARMDRLVGDITHTKVFDFLKGRSEILDEDPETP